MFLHLSHQSKTETRDYNTNLALEISTENATHAPTTKHSVHLGRGEWKHSEDFYEFRSINLLEVKGIRKEQDKY